MIRHYTSLHIYTMSQKNCTFLFLSELRQYEISINFNKFWHVHGKVAYIVRCTNIFHLT